MLDFSPDVPDTRIGICNGCEILWSYLGECVLIDTINKQNLSVWCIYGVAAICGWSNDKQVGLLSIHYGLMGWGDRALQVIGLVNIMLTSSLVIYHRLLSVLNFHYVGGWNDELTDEVHYHLRILIALAPASADEPWNLLCCSNKSSKPFLPIVGIEVLDVVVSFVGQNDFQDRYHHFVLQAKNLSIL